MVCQKWKQWPLPWLSEEPSQLTTQSLEYMQPPHTKVFRIKETPAPHKSSLSSTEPYGCKQQLYALTPPNLFLQPRPMLRSPTSVYPCPNTRHSTDHIHESMLAPHLKSTSLQMKCKVFAIQFIRATLLQPRLPACSSKIARIVRPYLFLLISALPLLHPF